MKIRNTIYKVAFVYSAIIVFLGVIMAIMYSTDGFGIVLGLVCLGGGLLGFLLSLITYISSSKEFAKGFLLSGAILLLLSGLSCGTSLTIS